MIEKIRIEIKETLEKKYKLNNVVVEAPKRGNSDLSIPLFGIAKELNLPITEVFNEFSVVVSKLDLVTSVLFVSGFLNIFLDRKKLGLEILTNIHGLKFDYGSLPEKNEVVVIDYSAPNIAKSFGVGHLRSTVIGNSLKLLYRKSGYQVIGINHLGDWGTQFGKMIVAYQLWGNKKEIEKRPIIELQKLYVKFHDEVLENPELEQQGRDAFRKLEEGDLELLQLWQWFRDESLKEFMDVYKILDVDFESYDGEAFYNEKMIETINELERLGLLVIDDGATIVDLGHDVPPALIRRSDGATLYMTRDLTALIYRHQTYDFKKMIYVVGSEQALHFKQLELLSKKMGYDFDIEHVNFGLVFQDGKKMSTRSGRFAKLIDVLEEAIQKAHLAISEKNPELANKEEIAKIIGIGAVLFNDLKNERHLSVDFDIEQMVRFEGQTGPYLLYSLVRIHSILRENELVLKEINSSFYEKDHYFEIISQLADFPYIIQRAVANNAPSMVAKYLLSVSQSFNHFYGREKILAENIGQRNANLLLITAVLIVVTEGLRLLGMKKLERM